MQYPSMSSHEKDVKVNSDGSVDVYLGPKAPAGFEHILGADDSGEGLVCDSSSLRSAGGVVQQYVAAGRNRSREVRGEAAVVLMALPGFALLSALGTSSAESPLLPSAGATSGFCLRVAAFFSGFGSAFDILSGGIYDAPPSPRQQNARGRAAK